MIRACSALITHCLCLILTTVIHEACASELPSNIIVKAALIKAVDLTRGHDIFNIYDWDKDGVPSTYRFRDVEIKAERLPSGSVRVLFSLPISNVMISAGRKRTERMLEVSISQSSTNCTAFRTVKREASQADEKRLCAAIAVVLGKELEEKPIIEAAVGAWKRGDGLVVSVSLVPYVPDGDMSYPVSAKNELLDWGSVK